MDRVVHYLANFVIDDMWLHEQRRQEVLSRRETQHLMRSNRIERAYLHSRLAAEGKRDD
jgi:hypothetical protein